MLASTNLLFSKFKSQEFEQLSQLLCSLFKTSPSDLATLYKDIDSTFDDKGWPPHSVSRDFYKSLDEKFRSTYQKSHVVAVDLPSLMELDDKRDNKPTVVIIGQDPKNGCKQEQLVIGTPYGLHHKGSREELRNTKLYFEMIQVLLELGYRVYLTDILKIWVCNPERPYFGIKLPPADQQRFTNIIKPELAVVKPVAVITWGNIAGNTVDKLKLDIEHLKFIHPSGAANGAFKKLTGMSPTDSNKLEYWRQEISQKLGKSIEFNLAKLKSLSDSSSSPRIPEITSRRSLDE
jgi:Uracil DNA glycosylase superfamily